MRDVAGLPLPAEMTTHSAQTAVVAALEREVRPLVKGWRVSEKAFDGKRFRFFEDADVVVVCGGIGPQAARRAAEAVIAIFEPKLIYSAGFAGALDARLKVGEVVRPARVISANDGTSANVEGGDGILVSFESVATREQKGKLRDSFGAHFVDMEASAVARAAQARGIAFSAVKAISDEVDFEFPSMEQFVDSEGHFRERRFARFAVVRPWLWPQVVSLARNSNRASRALCGWLRTLGRESAVEGSESHSSASV